MKQAFFHKNSWGCSGQTIAEYVIVIVIVIGAAGVLTPMLKRGTQSLVKSAADQIGSQANAEDDRDPNVGGYMTDYDVKSNTTGETKTTQRDGLLNIGYDETQKEDTTTGMLLGVTQK